jgi:general secretion pathway protein M
MIGKLSNWYLALSLREKILVGIAAALSFVLVAIYGLYLPLVGLIEAKRIEYRAALERRVAIEAMVASQTDRSAIVAAPKVSGPIEQLVSQRATEAGFAVEKAEAARDGRVVLAMAQARPPALLKWLAELEQAGIAVEQIDIKTGAIESVAVTATLAGQAQ